MFEPHRDEEGGDIQDLLQRFQKFKERKGQCLY